MARRWGADYAFYKTGPDKYLLFFKSNQEDAVTACFGEYSRRVLWDEAANIGQVSSLEKLVAVIRSREVSLTLFYQQLAQCKAIYDNSSPPKCCRPSLTQP